MESLSSLMGGDTASILLREIPVFLESSLVYHVRLCFSGCPNADATRRKRIGWRPRRKIWLWFLLGSGSALYALTKAGNLIDESWIKNSAEARYLATWAWGTGFSRMWVAHLSMFVFSLGTYICLYIFFTNAGAMF